MKWNRAELLFALALLLAAPGAARAQGTAPGGPDIMTCAYSSVLPTLVSGQSGYVQCDQNGRLLLPGASGGGTGGAVYGPTPEGTAPTQPPIYNGFKDASGQTRGVSPSTPFPTADQNAAQTITAPGTAPAKAQGVQRADGTAVAGDGTDNTGVTQLNGGTGIRGWLSGIYGALTNFLKVNLYLGGTAVSSTAPLPTVLSTGGTVTTSQASITATAAALTFSGSAHREVYNMGTATIFIGASGVTTTTGYPVPPGTSYDATRYTGALYAVSASAQTAALISY